MHSVRNDKSWEGTACGADEKRAGGVERGTRPAGSDHAGGEGADGGAAGASDECWPNGISASIRSFARTILLCRKCVVSVLALNR